MANQSPTPASKINNFLGLFDDIWGSRAAFPGRFWWIPGVRAGSNQINIYILMASQNQPRKRVIYGVGKLRSDRSSMTVSRRSPCLGPPAGMAGGRGISRPTPGGWPLAGLGCRGRMGDLVCHPLGRPLPCDPILGCASLQFKSSGSLSKHGDLAQNLSESLFAGLWVPWDVLPALLLSPVGRVSPQ